MHILSFLAIIFFGLCALVAAQPPQVQLYEFQDGTHAYVAHARYAYMPSDNQQRLLAQTEYNRAVQQAAFDGKVAPSAMSASWWPDRYGRGGTMILHSSIKVSLVVQLSTSVHASTHV